MTLEAAPGLGAAASGEAFDAPVHADSAIPRATDITGVLVLKHDRRFVLTDAYGDLQRDGRGLGLYLGDTRMLSTYELRLNGQRPVVLRTGAGAGFASTIQLTNPDLLRNPADKVDPDVVLSRQSLGIVRDRVVADAFTETIRIDNYTLHPERCTLTFRLDSDFADIFEVRGVVRERRGHEEPTVVDGRAVTFAYVGLDGRRRTTTLSFSAEFAAAPAYLTAAQAVDGVRHGASWAGADGTPEAATHDQDGSRPAAAGSEALL